MLLYRFFHGLHYVAGHISVTREINAYITKKTGNNNCKVIGNGFPV